MFAAFYLTSCGEFYLSQLLIEMVFCCSVTYLAASVISRNAFCITSSIIHSGDFDYTASISYCVVTGDSEVSFGGVVVSSSLIIFHYD